MIKAKTHQIQVNGKRYLVTFLYLKKVRIASRQHDSFISFSRYCKERLESTLVFMNLDTVLSEDLLISGIYHSLKDRDKYGVKISKTFAIDVLAHLMCTDQINFIQDHAIPRNLMEPGVELENVVINIITTKNGNDFQANLNQLVENELVFEEIDQEKYFTENSATIVDFYLSHVFKELEPRNGGKPDLNEIKAIHEAEMAVFSLQLQLKA